MQAELPRRPLLVWLEPGVQRRGETAQGLGARKEFSTGCCVLRKRQRSQLHPSFQVRVEVYLAKCTFFFFKQKNTYSSPYYKTIPVKYF